MSELNIDEMDLELLKDEKSSSGRKMGAPKKSVEEKQWKKRMVYMTPATLEKIKNKAEKAGESFSGYVQKCALEAAE